MQLSASESNANDFLSLKCGPVVAGVHFYRWLAQGEDADRLVLNDVKFPHTIVFVKEQAASQSERASIAAAHLSSVECSTSSRTHAVTAAKHLVEVHGEDRDAVISDFMRTCLESTQQRLSRERRRLEKIGGLSNFSFRAPLSKSSAVRRKSEFGIANLTGHHDSSMDEADAAPEQSSQQHSSLEEVAVRDDDERVQMISALNKLQRQVIAVRKRGQWKSDRIVNQTEILFPFATVARLNDDLVPHLHNACKADSMVVYQQYVHCKGDHAGFYRVFWSAASSSACVAWKLQNVDTRPDPNVFWSAKSDAQLLLNVSLPKSADMMDIATADSAYMRYVFQPHMQEPEVLSSVTKCHEVCSYYYPLHHI